MITSSGKIKYITVMFDFVGDLLDFSFQVQYYQHIVASQTTLKQRFNSKLIKINLSPIKNVKFYYSLFKYKEELTLVDI